MAPRNITPEPTSNRSVGALGVFMGGNSRASLLICGALVLGCGDGIGRPIRADVSSTGSEAQGGTGAYAVGGNGGMGLLGPGGNFGLVGPIGTDGSLEDVALVCGAWPTELVAAEEEMLTVLNALRQTGTPCAGSSGSAAAPLLESPSLHCLARVRSITAFTVGLPLEQVAEFAGVTEVTEVTLASELPAGLSVPALLKQEVQSGGASCLQLLSPQFSVVGIGFAESVDSTQGYWTIYLAGS